MHPSVYASACVHVSMCINIFTDIRFICILCPNIPQCNTAISNTFQVRRGHYSMIGVGIMLSIDWSLMLWIDRWWTGHGNLKLTGRCPKISMFSKAPNWPSCHIFQGVCEESPNHRDSHHFDAQIRQKLASHSQEVCVHSVMTTMDVLRDQLQINYEFYKSTIKYL